ncbi:group-specific protein [Mesobacillus jeotgali]|uniref:group-specific protein n=1 Tax=Mesobacillus jeotgali TaxID=129985 RepID=UPI0009A801D0|nr:group-specific protein [Mesobacillus jeotgali]
MKKFYVASSFKNIEAVRYISRQLVERGYLHTYDWTRNDRASTFEDLTEIGQREKAAVMEADFLLVLLPAGKGSHIELGIALGLGKRIYLHSPDGEVNHLETTSTFYHLPEVRKCIGSMEELIFEVMEREVIAQSVME